MWESSELPDSQTPEGTFVLPNYLLLLYSRDSFQVNMFVFVPEKEDTDFANVNVTFVHDHVSADRQPLAKAK